MGKSDIAAQLSYSSPSIFIFAIPSPEPVPGGFSGLSPKPSNLQILAPFTHFTVLFALPNFSVPPDLVEPVPRQHSSTFQTSHQAFSPLPLQALSQSQVAVRLGALDPSRTDYLDWRELATSLLLSALPGIAVATPQEMARAAEQLQAASEGGRLQEQAFEEAQLWFEEGRGISPGTTAIRNVTNDFLLCPR